MKTIPCSPPPDGDYGIYAMDCEMYMYVLYTLSTSRKKKIYNFLFCFNLHVSLCIKYNDKSIGGHDSLEDAVSCMDLMHYKVREDARFEKR
ncbi:hypothetical protein KUTeg_015886 [Tegillarca granosa]|uniref:Exonuclease domain-containing protein n=1 Tax=Tegillarca granosa TaxID=220873 RepID=A0ABQ9ELT8_TEGGR|nr:hypothetical protein KUTeg_015886 [Tegillarca granosa]